MPMSFEEAARTNPIVAAGVQARITDREIIGCLVDAINGQNKTIDALSATMPRKYRLPDGRVVVWHCPDELLPIEDLPTDAK